MNRPEAKALGLERYNTGRPCKHGHFNDRRTNNGVCLGCEPHYWRRYAHDEKTLVRQKRASIKYRDKIIERTRKWREANPGKRNVSDAVYRERNREKVKASKQKWVNSAEGRAYYKAWRIANIDKCRASARNLKAKRKKAPGHHTAADVRDINRMQRGKCAYCRVKLGGKYHVDHIEPIKRGGSNYRQNIQLLCGPCNMSKGAKDPIEHVRQLGLLI